MSFFMFFMCSEADIKHVFGHSGGPARRRPIIVELNVHLHSRRGAYARTIHRLWRHILATSRTIMDTASDLGKEAKDSIEELSRSAGRKVDAAREETGGALHAAASCVRKTGRQGSEAIENLATGTADRLDDTASYVEDHDLRDALTGLRRFGRRHLTGSLVVAGAIGFLAGSALCRATRSRGTASGRTEQ